MQQRTKFIQYMQKNEIRCVFHYVPLHSSEAGKKFGVFSGEDLYTTEESERKNFMNKKKFPTLLDTFSLIDSYILLPK